MCIWTWYNHNTQSWKNRIRLSQISTILWYNINIYHIEAPSYFKINTSYHENAPLWLYIYSYKHKEFIETLIKNNFNFIIIHQIFYFLNFVS